MTEREPFAFVRHETTVFIGNRFIADFDFKEDADFATKEINAAFDARVKEAEKKAVEKFKIIVASEVYKNCGSPVDAKDLFDFILALPAEEKP